MAATIGTLSNGGNTVPYWGYYAGQNYFDQDPMSGAPGQQFMAALRKYDPNAQFVQTTMGESGSPVWTLQYDISKMPNGHKIGNGQVDMNGGDYAPEYYSIGDAGGFDPKNASYGGNFRGDLFNPGAINNDPVWGKTTDPRNVKPEAASWVDKFGPMLVGAAGFLAPMAFGAAGLGMGTSGAAQAAIGAANGGIADTAGGVAGLGGVSTPLATAIGKGLPNMAQSAANHDFNPVSLIPYGGAAFGLPSWLTTGATTLGNLARGAKLNFNPVQLAIAATQLGAGGLGGK